jgi:multiple sugar transport system permease protein
MKVKASWKVVTYLLLILWAVFTVAPLYWLLSATFKVRGEAIGYPPTLVPNHPTLKNFGILLFHSRFGFKSYLNSIIIATGATLISTGSAMLAGFGFSRYRFPFRSQLLVFILLLQMIPLLAVIIPLYKLYSLYGLYDTRLGLMIVYAVRTVSMNTWLLKGYFDTVPVEIEEAALIDGCSRLQAFFRVAFPIAAPGVAAAAIFAFFRSWNEFMIAMTLTSRVRPYTVELYRFLGEQGEVDWSLLGTASFIAIVPVLILFSLFQKYFIIGLAGGALKQ